MSFGHGESHARGLLACGLLMTVAWVMAPTRATARVRKAALSKQDEVCLACHGTAGMKSDKGKSVYVDPAKHAKSAHAILGCTDCHTAIKDFPHPAKFAKVQCATCHADEVKAYAGSAHAILGEAACATCHGNVHELTSATTLVPGKCSECHADEVKNLAGSIHGQAAEAGDPDAPKCESCHGPIHQAKSAGEPSSTVARRNLADTCARCHSDAGFLSRHRIPIAHPVESYKQSVHGRAVASGNEKAADCSSCHGNHDIYPARDGRSSVNHWKVPTACGQCHTEIARQFNESVHGEGVKAGDRDAPVCTDCHGEHLIMDPSNPASPLNAEHISEETCGRCHNDARLALRNNLPLNRVPTYAESYHGLAMKGGKLTAANCASCHGAHDILPASDPRSTVNDANLPKTCGQCHKGVGKAKFTIGPVHVQGSTGPNHPIVQWIRWTYWVLIPFTLGFMLLHNLLDLLMKLIRRRPRQETSEVAVRMNLGFRIAHWGVMASFPTLVLTGFALKYPESWWARPLMMWESNAGLRGGLHRAAAIVLIAATLYHFVHLALKKRDRRFLTAMIPTIKDATDILDVFRYNLGLTKEEPKFGKFNYAEKMEYWAFLWGMVVMGLSGFILWFNNFTLRHFPKWVADAATAVHWYEALLATFSILIWHFYWVIFDPAVYPMDTAWLNGKIPADHYRRARPGYYRELGRAGLLDTPEETDSGESQPEAARGDN
jgi:formate dehydrogenase gamma subunit